WAPVLTLNDVSSQVKEHFNVIEKSKLFDKRIYIDDVTDDIFDVTDDIIDDVML
ncbi:hypothetical protein Tco_1479444, partial [Tanacetum coccineum]